MRSRTKRLAGLLAAGVAMAATLVLAPMPAVADTLPFLQWPTATLDDLPNANHLVSDPAGGVTVGCSSNSIQAATKSFDTAGTVVKSRHAVDQPRLFTCAGTSVVSGDGTLYTTARVSDGWEHEQRVLAYRGDALLWSYTAPCGVHASISSMTTGLNGNLYFLLSGGGSTACSATQLIGLAPTLQPGETTPATVVSVTLPGYATGLAVYNDGLAVRYASGIEHLDYSGNPYQSGPNPVNQVQYWQTPDPQFDATMDGRVFLPIPATGGEALGCANSSNVISTINAYDQTGRQFSTRLPACAEVVATRAFYKCYSASACNTAHPQLYAAKMPGLQMDYPRGAILSAGQPMLSYVALGDSISSGEGVPPFEVGTDVDNSNPAKKNMCHRSYGAYSRLLSGDPVHRLALQSFVACSGATTDNVLNGQDAEGPQIEALSLGTGIVTLTIGGDDIDFKKFVIACVNPADDCSGAAHDEAISKIPTCQAHSTGRLRRSRGL